MRKLNTNNPTIKQLQAYIAKRNKFARHDVAMAIEAYRDEPSLTPSSASYIYAGKAIKKGVKDGVIDKIDGRYYCYVKDDNEHTCSWSRKKMQVVQEQSGTSNAAEPVNDVTTGKSLTITLPDTSSKAFWSGTGKHEVFHPETYKRWVKEAIERDCVIARIGVEVK